MYLSIYLGKKSLCMNIWSINSFEDDSASLGSLLPLVQLTGGGVTRFVLGLKQF
jgi:hypothetical protein